MHEIRNASVSRPFCIFRCGCCFSDYEPERVSSIATLDAAFADLSNKSYEPVLQFFMANTEGAVRT